MWPLGTRQEIGVYMQRKAAKYGILVYLLACNIWINESVRKPYVLGYYPYFDRQNKKTASEYAIEAAEDFNASYPLAFQNVQYNIYW